jgi:hypothetical protein
MQGPRGGGWGGGSYAAWNRGDRQIQPPSGTIDPQAAERAWRETVRDLQRLQGSLEGSADLAGDAQDLIRQFQRVDPSRFPGNPELLTQLHAQMLAGVEQLEMRLRREIDDKNGGSIRSGSAQQAPPGYAQSVAEYFRRLSKGK